MRCLYAFFLAGFFALSAPALANSARDLAESLQMKAENGDIAAAYKLGLLWSQGKKIAPDYFTAAEWFERSAQAGYTRAMLKIADMYLEGQGVPKDPNIALQWYEKAARKDSKEAIVKTAELYALNEDSDKAVFWYEKGAVRGDETAMRALGQYYYKGHGVHFNLTEAFVWLELAAQKGDYQAKALQRELIAKKGQNWADDLRRKVNNRMLPESYWNAR